MFRFDAGEDVDAVGGFAQRGVVKQGQFTAGQGFFRIQADLTGDGERGDRVVAGDHLDPHAGRMAVADGADGRLAGWVDHADEADQGELFDAFHGQPAFLAKIEILAGQQQHAHALSGVSVGDFFDGRWVDGQWLAIGRELINAERQQTFEGAFDIDHALPVALMGGGHELPAGVKRQGIATWK